jgi:ABC-type glutathione transport system ATPase component
VPASEFPSPAEVKADSLEIPIRLTDVYVHFGKQAVLNGVSLKIAAGEIVGITGASAAGKSTLARILAGLNVPGASITGQLEVCRQSAFVPQEPSLCLSPFLSVGSQVLDCVPVSTESRPAGRQKAIECVQQTFLHFGLTDIPRIYHAYPHELSGGQRQRIAWAQAWVKQPAVLVADEPTSALDSLLQWEIVQQVQQLVRVARTTLVWVSHDLHLLAALGGRLIVLDQGRIVEDGPVQSILKTPLSPAAQRLSEAWQC